MEGQKPMLKRPALAAGWLLGFWILANRRKWFK